MRERLFYERKKSIFRLIIQNLFLSSLKLISGKKYNQIKINLKKNIEEYKRFFKEKILLYILKIKYPKYYSLPFGHLNKLDKMLKFFKLLENEKINFFLVSGTLLGAVRQHAFAGRPTDVDLGIKEKDEVKIRKNFQKFIKNGASLIRNVKEKDGRKKIQIVLNAVFIDLHIFKKKKIRKKIYWVGDSGKKKHVTLNAEQLDHFKKVNLYDLLFLAPSNPKKYLKTKYGPDWVKPDKKQFFWKKTKYIKKS